MRAPLKAITAGLARAVARLRGAGFLVAATLLGVVLAGPAQAQTQAQTQAPASDPAPLPRRALVVGNSEYRVGPLKNPRNDAQAMARRLREAGFEVTLQLDASRAELSRAIREYGQALAREKGVGLFYFAGHGVQLNWRNFLLPVDAVIRSKADVQAQAVDLGLLFDELSRARNAMNLVILDACRDNPFGPDFRVDDRGLSQIDAPPGTILAYATAPGHTAEDGEANNGLYTGQLLQEMAAPGAAVEDVFKRVRLSVRKASRSGQIPWESTSLEADFAFLPSPVPRNLAREFEQDLATWMTLRASRNPGDFEAFIRLRPNGKFAEMAQFRLDQLLAAQGDKPVRPRTSASAAEACAPGAPATYAGTAVPFRPGERYTYRRLDLASRKELPGLQSSVQKIEGDEVLFDDGKTVTDLFGNQVRAPDGRQWTPYQFFIADYQVGKRWSAQFLVTQPDGRQVNTTFDLRVAGRERITLGAGTFDVFRIEARGTNLTNGASLERTAWVAPEKMRGMLAQESVVRLNDRIVEGERIELTEYSATAGRSRFQGGYVNQN